MGVGYNPRIVTDGLIGYWDAGNTKSYLNYNLATYSQDFTNAIYIKSTGLVSATGLLAPDGTLTATTLTDDDTTYEKFSRTFTVPNDSSSYNISIYIKKTTGGTSSRTGFNIGFSVGGTLKAYNIRFNADTGVASGGDTILVTSENNSYWRLSFTISNNSTGNTNMYVDFFPATGIYDGPDLGAATGSHTVWGLQITRGTTLFPYKINVNDAVDTLYDLSNTGNNTTIVDGPTYNAGAFSFDGVANRIHGPRSFKWTVDGSVGYQTMTISMWYRTTDSNGYLYSKPWNSSGEYNIQIHPTYFWIRVGSAGFTISQINFDASAYNGNWNNIVCWMNTTNMGYYLNNNISASQAHSLTGGVTSLGDANLATCIMSLFPYNSGWAGNNNFSINGNMAICKVYNRVLSAAEVRQNYNALRGRFGV